MTVPGAWYDLASRIGNAEAVAGCIACYEGNADDRVLCLAGALQDLLMLAKQDVDNLERQLKAG